MTTHIIIDGYNLLWQADTLRSATLKNFEEARGLLIQTLAETPHLAGKKIFLIFDAWRTEAPAPTEERRKNIHIIYTRRGQRADEIIKDYAKRYGSGAVIVSSDKDVRRVAEKNRCGVLYSGEFAKMMLTPRMSDPASYENDRDDYPPSRGCPRPAAWAEPGL